MKRNHLRRRHVGWCSYKSSTDILWSNIYAECIIDERCELLNKITLNTVCFSFSCWNISSSARHFLLISSLLKETKYVEKKKVQKERDGAGETKTGQRRDGNRNEDED